jgi:hypothetical protein
VLSLSPLKGSDAGSSAAIERKSESLRGSGEVSTNNTNVIGLVRVENNLITKKKNWRRQRRSRSGRGMLFSNRGHG